MSVPMACALSAMTGSASTHDAQKAPGADRVADRRPNPPMRPGSVATRRARASPRNDCVPHISQNVA
eukprot:3929702-Pyramimonas_sp.AAC.1